MRRAAIVSPLRTAVGGYGGTLRPVPAEKMLAAVIKALIERTGLDPMKLDDVIVAQSYANGETPCIGRYAVLEADLPIEIPGYQLDRRCSGGLQAVPAGQHDAAAALGLGHWQSMRCIILPQALRAVVPSVMNSAVSIFKDTSLVTVVSLYELTGSLSLALAGDAEWRSYHLEGYLFIGLIYWIGCYAMSRFSQGLEIGTGDSRLRS